MNFRVVRIILAKEFLEILRDKRALILGLAVPLLLYPALMIASGQVGVIYWAKTEKAPARVALGLDTDPTVETWLADVAKIEIVDSTDPQADLIKGKLDAVVSAEKDVSSVSARQGSVHVVIEFDGLRPGSWRAMRRVEDGLTALGKTQLETRLKNAGLNPEFAAPVSVKTLNVTPVKRLRAHMIAGLLSTLAITMITLGALYPAIDLTIGEKTRGTFETLLSTPVSKSEIVCGKFLTVVLVALATVVLNVGSMAASAALLLWQVARQGMSAEIARFVDITPGVIAASLLVFLLILIPLAFLLCAMLMSAALLGRDYKDANYYVTPVVILFCWPTIAAMLPGVKLSTMTQFLPVVNVALLFKDMLAQEATLQAAFAVFLSTGVYAFLALLLAIWLFQREEVILSEEKGFPLTFRRAEFAARPTPTAGLSLLLFAVAMLLMFYGGIPVQSWRLLPGLLITEWVLILLPPLAILWYTRVNLRTALSLRLPSWRALAATLVIAAGSAAPLLQIALWQERILPIPEEMIAEMKRLLEAGGPWGVGLGIFAIAVSPAICEEILFRGAILSGLRTKLSPVATVVVVGVLFGVIHGAVWRIFITALLGMVLAYIVLRSGSIFVGMLYHFLVNGFAVLYANQLLPSPLQRFMDSGQLDQRGVPAWLLVLSGLAFLAGIGLMERFGIAKYKERGTNEAPSP